MSGQDSTYPIYDPAVITPREVLVGESPIDRIAAPTLATCKGMNCGCTDEVNHSLEYLTSIYPKE